MSGYKGLFTFDIDNHRYVPVEQADGIISDMNYHPEPEEEPKRTWFIDTNCVPNYIDYGDNPITDHCYDDWNELGICFETKGEAEKAVEKLKAWKRLKDKRFFSEMFNIEYRNVLCGGTAVTFELVVKDKEVLKDLKILFGDEEQWK